MLTRRRFVYGAMAGAAVTRWTARSHAAIPGANDRVQFAVAGLNSRASAHLSALKANKAGARITHICDVDTVIMEKFAGRVPTAMGEAPTKNQDFRKALDSRDVDAITNGTPDHWHTPMAMLAMQPGKHVMTRRTYEHGWEPRV